MLYPPVILEASGTGWCEVALESLRSTVVWMNKHVLILDWHIQ